MTKTLQEKSVSLTDGELSVPHHVGLSLRNSRSATRAGGMDYLSN